MNEQEQLELINRATAEKWENLDLSGRGLTELSPAIGQLTNLTILSLSRNQLTNIPPEIGQLSRLTELYLSSNQLTAVPSEIGQLTKLAKLHLWDNELTAIPLEIGQLTGLTNLYLSRNQLMEVPPEIGQLPRLTTLDLSRNNIRFIPWEIAQLPSLISLNLRENPVHMPPPEILNLDEYGKADLIKIRSYFQQLAEAGEDRLFEAKLIIVGEAGAGKTSLARKIQDSANPLPRPGESTEGIDVYSWGFPLSESHEPLSISFLVDSYNQSSSLYPEFRVNIWDFGGQEIY
ncbi:MAG: leucine-rich repeat domain-containing protein, partial [Anaerolineales bacterium]|nr:leucine-rich repeat domain-containing protein [Anaerolineales bacterium]